MCKMDVIFPGFDVIRLCTLHAYSLIFDTLKLIFTCSATKMKTLFMWMAFQIYSAFLLYAFQMDSVFNVSMNESFDHKEPKNTLKRQYSLIFFYLFYLRNFCLIFDGPYTHTPFIIHILYMPGSEVWEMKSKKRTHFDKNNDMAAVCRLRHLSLWKKMMMINVHRYRMKGKRFTLFNFNCVLFYLQN